MLAPGIYHVNVISIHLWVPFAPWCHVHSDPAICIPAGPRKKKGGGGGETFGQNFGAELLLYVSPDFFARKEKKLY